jgi:hypothetical protein
MKHLGFGLHGWDKTPNFFNLLTKIAMIDWRERISVDPNTRHHASKGLALWFGSFSFALQVVISLTMFSEPILT